MSLRALSVAAFAALVASASAADAVTLATAQSAYRDNHIADAEQQLRAVAVDPTASDADRSDALLSLGRIDWLVRGQTGAMDAAVAHPMTGPERCAQANEALQTYRDAGAPARGLAAAEGAIAFCSVGGAETMHVRAARAHLDLAATLEGSARAEHLDAAATQLSVIEDIARGTPDVARTRLSCAMAQRDASAALQAWRDYFWLTSGDAPQAMSAYVGRVQTIFTAGLAHDASDAGVLELITMLTRAGFIDDARLLAEQTGLAARVANTPEWRRVAAYFAFDRSVREITLRANRLIASGGHADTYVSDITAAANTLDSVDSGQPGVKLSDAFGEYGSLGLTGGYPSLHAGHVVEDRHISVDEYGHRGELRFIVIDNMIANGYESWLWDGWAEAGGWSGSGAIVQIRSAYTDGPLRSLRIARPGPARAAFLTTLREHEADERAALGRDGVAALPATSERLDDQAYQQIIERVGADNGAFIAEVWRATNQYSIAMHEGRHAIDNAIGHYSAPELEYRAKLSQIALADYPRLGLASVAAGPINDTPHGIGNRRVLEAYQRWMRTHPGAIAGFDASQPTLSQLDKLTDAQIVAVVRAIDPLAHTTH